MATDSPTASILTLHPPVVIARPKTAAERARDYRRRKAAERSEPVAETARSSDPGAPVPTPSPSMALVEIPAIPAEPVPCLSITAHPDVTTTAPVTLPVTAVTPASRPAFAPALLSLAAVGLTGVGIVMNGTFAHGLGSTELSSWLFMTIGVAADLVALAVPSCAARLWQAHQRGTAAMAWLLWLGIFAFTTTAGIGFASVNISDVTLARSSRVTPAVTAAQAALNDAVTSRDRECKTGVGKVCREREDAVVERRRNLDAAQHAVEQAADPQVEAASRIVAWLSLGRLRPAGDDFAMLRLVLLSLLPQLGGILLMIGRQKI